MMNRIRARQFLPWLVAAGIAAFVFYRVKLAPVEVVAHTVATAGIVAEVMGTGSRRCWWTRMTPFAPDNCWLNSMMANFSSKWRFPGLRWMLFGPAWNACALIWRVLKPWRS